MRSFALFKNVSIICCCLVHHFLSFLLIFVFSSISVIFLLLSAVKCYWGCQFVLLECSNFLFFLLSTVANIFPFLNHCLGRIFTVLFSFQRPCGNKFLEMQFIFTHFAFCPFTLCFSRHILYFSFLFLVFFFHPLLTVEKCYCVHLLCSFCSIL